MSGPWPAIPIIIKQLLVCLFLEDFLFYWIHRLLHHRLIYKYVHKRHHEFKQNVGIAVGIHFATVPCYRSDFDGLNIPCVRPNIFTPLRT